MQYGVCGVFRGGAETNWCQPTSPFTSAAISFLFPGTCWPVFFSLDVLLNCTCTSRLLWLLLQQMFYTRMDVLFSACTVRVHKYGLARYVLNRQVARKPVASAGSLKERIRIAVTLHSRPRCCRCAPPYRVRGCEDKRYSKVHTH